MIQKQRSIFKTIWIIALIGLMLLLMRQLINGHEKIKSDFCGHRNAENQ